MLAPEDADPDGGEDSGMEEDGDRNVEEEEDLDEEEEVDFDDDLYGLIEGGNQNRCGCFLLFFLF